MIGAAACFLLLVGLEVSTQASLGVATVDRLGAALPVRLFDERLTDPSSIQATYTNAPRAMPGVAVNGRDGTPATLATNEVVYSDQTNELLRLDANGKATRLRASEGQRVTLANLGPWDPAQGKLAGLDATYRDGRWMVDASKVTPSNRDWTLAEGGADTLGSAWIIQPPNVGTMQRLSDAEGPYVRFELTTPAELLQVMCRELPADTRGAPLTLRAHVRSNRPGSTAQGVVYEFGSGPTPIVSVARSITTAESATDGSWTTLTVRVPSSGAADERNSFSIGISGLQVGDHFDLRDIALYVGSPS